MLEVHKNYVLDENQRPIAVQIPIAEVEKIEEILEDYGLAKLMEQVEEEEPLSKDEALKFYQLLKEKMWMLRKWTGRTRDKSRSSNQAT